MNNKVTIIGAGNGGLTAAYHFSKRGYEVCVYDSPAFPEQIESINKTNTITALSKSDEDNYILGGEESIALATTSIEAAMNFSSTFVMICPTFAQEILFSYMIPYLKKNDIIILMPGNYGGLVLSNMIQDKLDLNITFVDAITIPWATRIVAPATISIMGLKEFLPLSIYPAEHATTETKKRIENLIPIPVEYLSDPIVAGLENINFGGHPLMTVVNIGLLENFDGEFNYYGDCCSTATANAAAKMDIERIAVANAYGYTVRTELEAMNALYASNHSSVYEFNRASKVHGKIKNAPNSSNNRYITEDIPYLLVPCYELAKAKGLSCKLIESVIHLANAYNNTNYFETGRTLKKMGL